MSSVGKPDKASVRRSERKKPKNCIFCSSKSIEQSSKLSGPKKYPHANQGLTCGKCFRFSCLPCLKLLIHIIPKELHDDWALKVLRFIQSGEEQGFVGSCCQFIDKNKKSTDIVRQGDELAGTSFAGCLFFPEFKLLIDSPFDCVDIHGVGEFAGHYGGAWHCVISPDAPLVPNKLIPRNIMLDNVQVTTLNISIPWSKKGLKTAVSFTMSSFVSNVLIFSPISFTV